MSSVSVVLMETWALSGASVVIPCLHMAHTPIYNASASQYQSVSWVAIHYPRFDGVCTACRQRTIIYANIEHAQAGGWL